jgi:hypothetical protein
MLFIDPGYLPSQIQLSMDAIGGINNSVMRWSATTLPVSVSSAYYCFHKCSVSAVYHFRLAPQGSALISNALCLKPWTTWCTGNKVSQYVHSFAVRELLELRESTRRRS